MTEQPLRWSQRDGWLLMAVYLSGKGKPAELHEIIGAADAIEHAIPTTGQMSRALTKFVQCGLVREEGGRYSIAPEHVAAVGLAYRGRGGIFDSGAKGLKWLRETRPSPRGTGTIELTDAEMKAAYDDYIKRLRRR